MSYLTRTNRKQLSVRGLSNLFDTTLPGQPYPFQLAWCDHLARTGGGSSSRESGAGRVILSSNQPPAVHVHDTIQNTQERMLCCV